MDRIEILYAKFIEEYEDDLEEVTELFAALIKEVPEAKDSELVEFAVETVTNNEEEFIYEIEEAVKLFLEYWGCKV